MVSVDARKPILPIHLDLKVLQVGSTTILPVATQCVAVRALVLPQMRGLLLCVRLCMCDLSVLCAVELNLSMFVATVRVVT